MNKCIGIGISLGLCFGVVLRVAIHNVGLRIGIGLPLGTPIGTQEEQSRLSYEYFARRATSSRVFVPLAYRGEVYDDGPSDESRAGGHSLTGDS
jgi:hypothetical protein